MKEKIMESRELTIADMLTDKFIKLEMKTNTKKGAILELAQLLEDNGVISDTKGFSEDVFRREGEGMTGIGNGLAIPHGKSDFVLKTSIAVGKAKKPIQWESLDEQPVNVIILFAVKNTEANTLHIKLLQKVAMLLADDQRISDIVNAETKDQLLQLLTQDPLTEEEGLG